MNPVLRSFCWLALLALCACRGPEPAPAPAVVAQPSAQPAATASSAASTPVAAAVPPVQSAVILPLHRPDDVQSRVLHLSELVFKKWPKPNTPVTLLALSSALPPLQLRIANVKETENLCSDALPHQFEIELEPITQTEYVDAVFTVPGRIEGQYTPFMVCVLYPANPQARALNRGLLNVADLPKGTMLANVILALDLDGDQTPDLVATEYCCDRPKAVREHCDLTCGKTYLRVAGVWKQIDATTPC